MHCSRSVMDLALTNCCARGERGLRGETAGLLSSSLRGSVASACKLDGIAVSEGERACSLCEKGHEEEEDEEGCTDVKERGEEAGESSGVFIQSWGVLSPRDSADSWHGA